MSVPPAKKPVWHHLGAFLLYALLALWLARPLLSQLGEAFAGSSTDALLHFWNGWVVREAIVNGQSLTFTRQLFFPEGASLLTHNMAWLNIFPWLLLQLVLDDIAAYNLVILLNLALVGFSMYLLASRLTGNYPAGFIAGLIYLAWPYRLSQLDHPNLVSTQWIPLLILFLILAIREGRWRYGLAAGVMLALVGYTRWQLLIPAGLVVATYLLFTAGDWWRDRRRWLILVLFGATAAVLLAPPAWSLLRQQSQSGGGTEGLLRDSEESVMQTDLLAYLTPGPGHPLLGEQTKGAYDGYYPERTALRRFPSYLGVVSLILAVVGIWKRPQEALPWLALAFGLILIALGPVLRVGGRLYPDLPTPYGILEPLTILRLLREPERFNMILALPVAILAGYGAAASLTWISAKPRVSRTIVWALVGLFSLFILVDYAYGPVPLQRPPSSFVIADLAGETGEFAIVNLPIDPIQSKIHMFDQTIHGRPLLQGHISRPPEGLYFYIDDNPLLRTMRQYDEPPPWLIDTGQQLATLALDGFRYLVVYQDQIGPDRIDHLQRYLVQKPAYEDERLLVYRTEPKIDRDIELLEQLEPGFGPAAVWLTSRCLVPGAPFEVDIAWGAASAVTGNYVVRLMLQDAAGEVRQAISLPLDNRQALLDLEADELLWAYYPWQIAGDLAPGDYAFTFEVWDESGPIGQRALETITVAAESCPATIPDEAIASGALFGDEMRLLGYQVTRPAEDRLEVILYWRGEQRMADDYQVFVHVFDPATDVPVAQDDSAPRRGGLPTRFWSPGEVIVDTIPVQLEAAPGGIYGLAIGVYDPLTLERRPLILSDGQQPEDRRLILPDVVTIGQPE